jgi:hypothetical protein
MPGGKWEVIKGMLDGVYTALSKGNYEFGGWESGSTSARENLVTTIVVIWSRKTGAVVLLSHNMELDCLTYSMHQTLEGSN